MQVTRGVFALALSRPLRCLDPPGDPPPQQPRQSCAPCCLWATPSWTASCMTRPSPTSCAPVPLPSWTPSALGHSAPLLQPPVPHPPPAQLAQGQAQGQERGLVPEVAAQDRGAVDHDSIPSRGGPRVLCSMSSASLPSCRYACTRHVAVAQLLAVSLTLLVPALPQGVLREGGSRQHRGSTATLLDALAELFVLDAQRTSADCFQVPHEIWQWVDAQTVLLYKLLEGFLVCRV